MAEDQISQPPIKCIATDLDGTLLNKANRVSQKNLELLNLLGEQGLCRMIATGRNLFSFRKVIPADFPIDYLIFSSGAGIMDWPNQTLLTRQTLPSIQVRQICEKLIRLKLDFMVHRPIPKNHVFEYHQSSVKNADFERRLALYRCFHQRLVSQGQQFGPATQIIVVSPQSHALHDRLRAALPNCHVVRTTSPLDHHSTWIELFPKHVSKSFGVSMVCEWKGIIAEEVLAVGNDYNDLDLLNWAGHAVVVSNAPEALRNQFPAVGCHNQDGFSEAVAHAINQADENPEDT